MAAIWKDYYCTINLTAAEFRILRQGYSGVVLYHGLATAKPGASSVSVRINDICASWLRTVEPNFDLRFTAGLLEMDFYVQYRAPGASAWIDLETVTFTNDWSYDYGYDPSRDGYTFPISQEADPRQLLMVTVPAGTTSVRATIYNEGGTTTSVVITVRRTNDFNNDYNGSYAHLSEAAVAGVAQLNLGSYPSAIRVTMAGFTWRVNRGRCKDYGIYYVNAYGGWDSLAMYGTQEDSYRRHEYATDYDNRKQSAIGRADFINEVDMRFHLRTPWITDLGASRMHHLVGTNMAVIHEFATGRILPITVVTDSVKYKTYRSEGRTPIAYDLEVAVAQDRQRR